jgi:hypothetical protein
MLLSQRMQNLQKNPTVARGDLHNAAAQMMGRKGVTKSVEKGLKESGLFHGKKRITKREFEKGVRKFSEHMEEKGIKENRYTKDMRKSLREKKGLVRGGQAEKAFRSGVQAQIGGDSSVDSFFDLGQGERRKFLSKMIEKGKLSKNDKELMQQRGLDPDKGTQELKKFAERITQMNQYQRAQEVEKEGNEATEGGKQDQSAGSASDYQKESPSDESKETGTVQQNSSSQKTVPLQGGIGGGSARIENPEMGMEQAIMAAENEAMQNRRAEQKSAEMPAAEHAEVLSKPEEEGSDDGIDDMEI